MHDSKVPILKPNEVIRSLEKAGFFIHHQTGSHVQLKHPIKHNLRITVPRHGKDLPKPIIRNIIRQADLSVEEFKALL
jgi:predicted RNA binding protein YcfA (HicA-like mRNA interferase family)